MSRRPTTSASTSPRPPPSGCSTTTTSASRYGSSPQAAQPRQPVVVGTEVAHEHPGHEVDVEGAGRLHLLEVGPVLGAAEERLEHGEVGARQERQRPRRRTPPSAPARRSAGGSRWCRGRRRSGCRPTTGVAARRPRAAARRRRTTRCPRATCRAPRRRARWRRRCSRRCRSCPGPVACTTPTRAAPPKAWAMPASSRLRWIACILPGMPVTARRTSETPASGRGGRGTGRRARGPRGAHARGRPDRAHQSQA